MKIAFTQVKITVPNKFIAKLFDKLTYQANIYIPTPKIRKKYKVEF